MFDNIYAKPGAYQVSVDIWSFLQSWDRVLKISNRVHPNRIFGLKIVHFASRLDYNGNDVGQGNLDWWVLGGIILDPKT